MRGATALHQPARRCDLVRAVDRDVEPCEPHRPPERLDLDAEVACEVLGRGRGRDAAQIESAYGERREQIGDRRARSEADDHAVLDELRRGLGGELLLVCDGQRAAPPAAVWRASASTLSAPAISQSTFRARSRWANIAHGVRPPLTANVNRR